MKKNNSKASEPLFFSMTFAFLARYLPHAVGRSPGTISSYRDTLTIFRRYVREKLEMKIGTFCFSHCTRACVLGFLEYLKQQGNQPSTRNHRLAGLKGYLAYAADMDVALQSIWLEVKRIKAHRIVKMEKPIIYEPQFRTILEHIPNNRKGVRNRTILILLYETAQRISELVSLRLSNLHLEGDKPYIHVVGKGRKERYIAITRLTAEHLNTYLLYYHKNGSFDTDFVFYTVSKGVVNSISQRSVQEFLQQYAGEARKQDATIPLKVHPHMLRRSKATTLYQNGMPLPLVSSFLGHSLLETTQIYAKPSLKMMSNALQGVNPGDYDYKAEEPNWLGKEDLLARKCGIR